MSRKGRHRGLKGRSWCSHANRTRARKCERPLAYCKMKWTGYNSVYFRKEIGIRIQGGTGLRIMSKNGWNYPGAENRLRRGPGAEARGMVEVKMGGEKILLQVGLRSFSSMDKKEK